MVIRFMESRVPVYGTLPGGLEPADVLSSSELVHYVQTQITMIQTRCQQLLRELQTFQDCHKRQKKELSLEVATYRSGIRSELASLEKVST